MIKEFSISNFKAFAKKQNIPLKPITLVFGENSSGKSSILQSLVWTLTEFEEKRGSANPVDLGGFENAIFKKNPNGLFRIELKLPLSEATGNELTTITLAYEIGLCSQERISKLSAAKPVPPPQVQEWLDARDSFLNVEKEFYQEYIDSPFVTDEDGVVKVDEDQDLIRHCDVDPTAPSDDSFYQKEIESKWDPKLKELWEKWREANSKKGIK